jgi:hypothetical protein
VKIGDLVKDDYGNVGLVLAQGVPRNESGARSMPYLPDGALELDEVINNFGEFYLVQFSPDTFYPDAIDWHYERDLEVIA